MSTACSEEVQESQNTEVRKQQLDAILEANSYVFAYLESIRPRGTAQGCQTHLQALHNLGEIQNFVLGERQCLDSEN